ncbi:hypothetical protein SERLADRAFT_444104 [Serpula lacrymans var. lacrymans S7.9]|uniref:DUF6830 domain-containing protein n=1 Tax=Serpula lacrymans var. lacrymans (strain S7.9) TaxID=578457 RepID=F8PEI2_SERL9|nr:uncharacterized protein SERLADRAFT_444104 [Serpula lacrymans var. lacrymans S7.9]EGO18433.1 hypothetical protein SERLADRAFT_444104 [Serpula lacrymans var. lacrymans S7.9]
MTFGNADNIIQQIQKDDLAKYRKKNIYYPFKDRDEWDFVKFLCENMNRSQIDHFLKLKWVQDGNPSFSSVHTLFFWIESLPSGSRWQLQEIKVEGYKTAKPMILLWRDGLEVARHLFANPVFANHIDLDPKNVFVDYNKVEKEYGEFMTAEYAWECQAELPFGATLLGMIGASDKTVVTRGTGGLEMHPIFLTLANIHSEVRMKATSHAWLCAGFLSIPKFDCSHDLQTLLSSRVYHMCIDKIVASLKYCARYGHKITDPFGKGRLAYTPLVAWIADLPEQQLIACISKNSSPILTASLKQFGDPFAHPSCHGDVTYQNICKLANRVHPWNKIVKYQAEAKKLGLSGVHLPFRRDWAMSDPASFLVPEILHTCHKFFFDHVLTWCKELVGRKELDQCFKVLHKRIGYRHFHSGVSHVRQMTGREHREIQRTILGVIAGCAPPVFIRAICAIIDFIYQAQSPVHTTSSLATMVDMLKEFHEEKDVILMKGARKGKEGPLKHFWIPKLELMQNFACSIKRMGSVMQYTTDVTEHLLITHCKHPFSHGTNHHHDFEQQCVQVLSVLERLCVFSFYTLLESHGLDLVGVIVEEEDSVVEVVNPELLWLSRVLPDDDHKAGPRPMRNLFIDGIWSQDGNTAFYVNKTVDFPKLSIDDAAAKFGLEDFRPAPANYTCQLNQTRRLGGPYDFPFTHVRVWFKFRIQQHSVHKANTIMAPQTVQAQAPSAAASQGTCDAVLAGDPSANGSITLQVRMVFQLIPPKNTTIPAHLSPILLYVQNFRFAGRRNSKGVVLEEPDIDMFLVERTFCSMLDSSGQKMRMGGIIPLSQVAYPVDLIPVFGSHIEPQLNANNTLERPTQFYLNNFSDKEIYQTPLSEL